MKVLTLFLVYCLLLTKPLSAFSFEAGNNKVPLEIKAQRGMICSQDKKRCTALGPVISTKGSRVLKSSKLVVYFKEPSPSNEKNARESPQQDLEKIEALGNVHFFDTHGHLEATGHYALYNATEGSLVLQGHPVLKEAKTTIFGGTKVIFYDKEQRAKTVGRSTIKRDDKLMQADVFHIYFAKNAKGESTFDRVEAQGNVVISTPTEIAKAKRGLYVHITQVVELFDDVVITRADGQLRGNYGRYDMASGQSQLFQEQGKHQSAKQVQAVLNPKAFKHKKEKKKTT